ncbi:MAG: cell division protein CrgA [Actinomycetes bacterium]
MPKSRIRRKTTYTPPPTTSPADMPSRAWVAPLMVSLFVLGLLWIVVFYITQGDLWGMSALGNWNLAVGFGFITGGFIVSTQWR